MLLANLVDLDEPYLQGLCNDKCPESQSLDFKQALPGTSPDEKQELMKDACAFANAEGGDVVYGIAEAGGAAGKIMPLSGELPDAAKRRIAQVLDGIEPRIQGVRVHSVDVSGGFVLVVRVPGSFDGPHSSRVSNLRRFVMRNGTSTTDMSFDQIRTAFDRTATLAERARQFIDERFDAIGRRQTWKPFIEGPICAVVMVPIAGMAGRKSVDIAALNSSYEAHSSFKFRDWDTLNRTMNLDGLVVHPAGTKHGIFAYTQVYRNGAIEALRTGAALVTDGVIPSSVVTEFYRDAVMKSFAGSDALGFTGPVVVRCALMNIKGYRLGVGETDDPWGKQLADADRHNLVLPDTWVDAIEEVKTPAQVDAILRPMMDVLWQAFDVERCFEFDATGKWSPRR